MRALLAGLLFASAASRLAAATVDVSVRDVRGTPLAGAWVTLERPAEDGPGPRFRGRTGPAGHARVEVRPGRWLVDASAPGHVAASRNPRLPPAIVDVRSDSDDVEAALVLAEAVRVRVAIEANRRAPRMAVGLDSLDGAPAESLALTEDALVREIDVVPGRWRVRPIVPAGWLLTSLLVDGRPAPGADAVLGLDETVERVDVVVGLDGMARASGRISIDGPAACNGSVAGTLLQAGPWLAAAKARGGSTYDVVPGTLVSRLCDWEAIVPSGLWRFTVSCELPCDVEPRFVDVAIDQGQVVRIDFDGAVASDASSGPTADVVVSVVGPDALPVAKALVQAFDARDAKAVVASDSTGDDGRAVLRVPAGLDELRLVAGHVDHVDAESAWRRGPDAVLPVLQLGASAGVRVQAKDIEGAGVPGVEIVAETLDEPRDSLADEALRRHRRGRQGLTRADGTLQWRGFHGGSLSLKARMTGADSQAWLVSFETSPSEPGADRPTAVVELVEGATTELTVRVRPAARVTLALDPRCTLPRESEVRVVPASRVRPDDEDVEALLADPVLRLARVARSGHEDLDVVLGPLPAGSWIVALRPEGFARWTLAPGVETLADAEPVETVEGQVARVESMDVDCAPLVEIISAVQSGGAAPDLRHASFTAVGFMPASAPAMTDLAPKILRSTARLESFPEGPGVLQAFVDDPHCAPRTAVILQKVNLERGSLLRVRTPWSAYGGAALVLSDAPVVGARASAEAGWTILVPTVDGEALVPSLLAGRWLIADCDDGIGTCQSVKRWREIVVEQGRTTRVE